jgi:hypothetical protein
MQGGPPPQAQALSVGPEVQYSYLWFVVSHIAPHSVVSHTVSLCHAHGVGKQSTINILRIAGGDTEVLETFL